jgi:hypothetical protein
MMDFSGLLEYLNIISSLLSLLAVVLVCWLRTIFATREEVRTTVATMERRQQLLEQRQDELSGGWSGLVGRIEDMPKAADLHALRVALEHLDGTQRAIQAEMKGTADILHIVKSQCERMNAYLLEKGH